MPALSLVVCLHREKEMLQRLLRESRGLFDDLIVVHDGAEEEAEVSQTAVQPPAVDYAALPPFEIPAGYHIPPTPARANSIHTLVAEAGGTFFVGPRSFQQEPHWPFAWSRAQHDWILRLDADEFPSDDLKTWLANFRDAVEPDSRISGYTCSWPMWNGSRRVTRIWPTGRNFLFHRQRVRYFGMVEQVPVADSEWEAIPLSLRHEPSRKSYGLANILVRRQGFHWRNVIAKSLLKEPADLPRWRWSSEGWPVFWSHLRTQSLLRGLSRIAIDTARTMQSQWRSERKLMPLMALATPLHHFVISRLVRKSRDTGKTTR